MLRQIPRRLLSRTLTRSPRSLPVHRPLVANCRRYANKKSPPDDEKPLPVSEHIASQKRPTNREIPADRMPSQTEEDIATKKILAGERKVGEEDGLPADDVPLEETGVRIEKVMGDGEKPAV